MASNKSAPKSTTSAVTARKLELVEDAGEEIKSRVIDITPEKAQKWLGRNHPDNRGVAHNRVEAFAGDMREGHWKVTHQGIAFDAEGRLIDGQHRLLAVVSSGKTVRMMVTWNVGTFGDPIDCGRPRSLGTLAGVHNRVISTVNTLRMLECGNRDAKPMTLAEFSEIRSHHEDAITAVLAIPLSNRLTAGIRAGLAYAYPIAPELILEFGGQIVSGERLVRGEPAFTLYHWRDKHRNIPTWDAAMATLNAVRHFLSGQPLAALYITPSGYRGVTSKRRAMKVPYTPRADLVLPGISALAPGTPPAPTQVESKPHMTFEDE